MTADITRQLIAILEKTVSPGEWLKDPLMECVYINFYALGQTPIKSIKVQLLRANQKAILL